MACNRTLLEFHLLYLDSLLSRLSYLLAGYMLTKKFFSISVICTLYFLYLHFLDCSRLKFAKFLIPDGNIFGFLEVFV